MSGTDCRHKSMIINVIINKYTNNYDIVLKITRKISIKTIVSC